MKNQKFGIEIELTGLTREKAAKVVANYFNSHSDRVGNGYDIYEIVDDQSRRWKVMNDASICAEKKVTGEYISAEDVYRVELVSPICTYDDIPKIQEIVRLLRKSGAIANNSTGIHIHIDASNHNPNTLRTLTNIIRSKEDILYKALQVGEGRAYDYCRKVNDGFIDRINRRKPRTLQQLNDIWYNGRDGSSQHYHSSRYHALNLHSVFQKGTVEFRLFNGTTHAGKIKSYIQLALAISHQALTQRYASPSRTQSENEKYTFRTWLLRLGLIGDEFKTARQHLLANLEGNIAWKDPTQANRTQVNVSVTESSDDIVTSDINHDEDEIEEYDMSMTM